MTRYPRYNNPSKLLETRSGRCGEWANVFCLLCRSLALDARWVLDLSDHVWVEVWMPRLGRFVHVDPCECKFDTPLLYEKGWGKKLTFVFSFSRYGVDDATARYTRDLENVLRRCGLAREAAVAAAVHTVDMEQLASYTARVGRKCGTADQSKCTLTPGKHSSSLQLLDSLVLGADRFEELEARGVSLLVCHHRRRRQTRELAAMSFRREEQWKLEEMQVRLSGDAAWIAARGEDGSGSHLESPYN
jgi:hypothetical protein